DRDYRTEHEIEGLKNQGVFAIDVAEIENILLNESTLRVVAENQHLDPDEVVNKSLAIAKKMLQTDLKRQISLRTCCAIENQLSRINNKAEGLDAIKETVAATLDSIDIDEIYKSNSELYQKLAEGNDLDEMLKYFNNKGLLSSVCSAFELGKNGYEKLVLRMLNSDKREVVLTGLRKYVPEI
ncbi:TPA: DUF4435 domain-containing protein, partial [Vibrio parahaemolyticus]|nr:DUF4435 domain-containing protein [Vibrio parahaemolyticus]HAS6918902.1 DUF4435 domain-containing protein [Vibrio parahaemolyticus]HAS6928947.1 DUF4435 domain-containing protein [Vibrio parahaemolyticus]